MEKHMDANTVIADWDRMLLDVAEDDNTIIIEQSGEPVAVLLPLHLYRHLQRTHEITDPLENYRSTGRRTEIRDELAD
jgi:prevent-host-death family protein